VLDALAARQILSLLLECGSRLNGAFLAHGLVDKAVLFHAPTALVEGSLPFAIGFGSPSQMEQSLKQITRTKFGPDTAASGSLRDPWAIFPSAQLEKSPANSPVKPINPKKSPQPTPHQPLPAKK
jgi:diaminohydroxyphosphoribosylaminopyrimidine deaminase/5-amino-6-(5-phosphoribosylamino)uracil reductase